MSKFLFRLRFLFFLFSFSSLMMSCSMFDMGYERYYTGAYKPLSDVSLVVTLTDFMAPSSSWIDIIDNQQAKKSVRAGVTFPSVRELHPGKHTICSRFQTIRTYSKVTKVIRSNGCQDLILDAKPGHVYLIYPRVKTHDGTWKPDYWDITGELHTSEMKGLASEIDRSLAKHRVNGSTVSVLSIATRQSNSPLVGFGEEYTSSLQKWLNKDVNVSYEFNRYVPYMVVEADDDIEYHLEINQKTGLVTNVLGKNVDIKGKPGNPVFQPLNSQNTGGKVIQKGEEQKNGSYIKVNSR